MLDQNTDRMWYVIGAIIIGGLILTSSIVLFTDVAFASVQDAFSMFSNVVDVSDVELIGSWDVEVRGGQYILPDGSAADYEGGGWGDEFIRHVDLAPYIEDFGLDKKYELKFELKSQDISERETVAIYNQNGSATRYSFGHPHVRATQEYQTYHLKDLTFQLVDENEIKSHLAFYGKYFTGNIPVVKNVRLYVVREGDD